MFKTFNPSCTSCESKRTYWYKYPIKYYVLKIAINAILNENKNVLIYDLFCSLQFDFFDHVILSHNAIGSGTTAGPKIKEYQKRTGTGQPQKLWNVIEYWQPLFNQFAGGFFCLTRLYGVLWITYNENKSPAYSGAYEVEYGGCGALRGREPRLRKDGSPNWRHSASATVQEKTNRNQP